ncbi:Protein PBN1 [Wickerhamiella sorbophila]|uniref:Protein PBN1 n=1 Tax=Wickerhamiella sorbophila TaxID=45607 RepID=A0A2T0FDP5_9ASCO|nr:Protein PBN1 [Wickerhamiella sorbophila]PRT53122.1 Protein PBN1 [Wickerhamiella sorbophila]
MRTRITYLIDDADGENPVEIKENNLVKLSGLQGEKHIRVVVPHALDGSIVYVSWTSEIHPDGVFDPPVEKGLHVDTLPDTEWSSLLPWLAQCGIDIDESQIVQAANWDSYTSLIKPSFACLKQYGIPDGAYALKITSGYANEYLTGVEANDLVIEAWYSRADWFETIEKTGDKTEVGFLSVDKMSTPADKTLYGFVHNVGVDVNRIMFHQVPSFRRVPGKAVGRFDDPHGLHPVFKLDLHVAKYNIPYGCKLFAQLDLPKSLFIDKYQMGDLPRVQPPLENLGVWGETDLEKPVWQTSKGSTALFRLLGNGYNETYQIPIHSRYEEPSPALHIDHLIGDPLVFWACQDDDFPQQHVPGLSFESIFPQDTVYHILESQPVHYKIPVISPEHRDFVYSATSLTVIAGTFLIIFAILQRLSAQHKLKNE